MTTPCADRTLFLNGSLACLAMARLVLASSVSTFLAASNASLNLVGGFADLKTLMRVVSFNPALNMLNCMVFLANVPSADALNASPDSLNIS